MNRAILASTGICAFLSVGLAIASVVTWLGQSSPSPAPGPDAPFVASFTGPTAAEDRALMGHLCASLADAIEQDGKRPEPRVRSGLQVEELRTVARDGRTRGVSIGERQPEARRAIGDYLDREAGKSGGPLDADGRARWVRAFRGVAAACGVQ